MRSRPLPKSILHFLELMLIVTASCLLTETYCNLVLHLSLVYTFPLYPEANRFADLMIYRARFGFFHSPAFFTLQGWRYMYPAPLSIAYKVFYLLPHSEQVFLLLALAWILMVSFLFARALRARGASAMSSAGVLLVLIFCSYALLFELRQANLELIVWVVLSCGLWAFWRGSVRTAAVCFGIATAMKLFPFVFLGLFVARRQYRHAFLSLAAAALTTLVSLWALCPDLRASWRGIADGLAVFRTFYVLHIPAFPYDHSLFGLVRFLLRANTRLQAAASAQATLTPILTAYLGLCAAAGILIYFARIRKLPVANQVLCLTVASILLPPISFDYTLIHLYAPLVLLLLIALDHPLGSAEPFIPGLKPALALFALLLAPETELISRGVTLEGQFKACCLVLLFVIGLRCPFRGSAEREWETSGWDGSSGRTASARI